MSFIHVLQFAIDTLFIAAAILAGGVIVAAWKSVVPELGALKAEAERSGKLREVRMTVISTVARLARPARPVAHMPTARISATSLPAMRRCGAMRAAA